MKADISGMYLIAGSGTRPEGAAPYLYHDEILFINHVLCVGPPIDFVLYGPLIMTVE